MRQHHPLENPSLAPYGFVFPLRQKRLEYQPLVEHWVNEEKLMARLWDRWNRSNAPRPLPVQTIIHDILPSLATANRLTAGDFLHDGLPYLSRDVLVLSSMLCWFGTNFGRSFLETDISRFGIPGYHPAREFRIKLARKMKKVDIVAHVTHVCNARCGTVRSIVGDCYHESGEVSVRDRAVVDGLMRWLASRAGRAFIAEFTRRKESAWEAARERHQQTYSHVFRFLSSQP